MVEQFSTYAADPTFRRSILPRAPNAGAQRRELTGSQELEHVISELGIMVEQHVSIGTGSGNASRSCCTIQSVVGWNVTLKCRMRRRSCSIAKKQYKVRNQRVGTVKKSNAAITSRWLFRKSEPLAGFAFLRNALQLLQI